MRAVLLALSAVLPGCLATPLAHPLRANDGFTAEASGTFGLFSGHAREASGTGTFNESSGTGSGVVSGSLGYAHVVGDHFGMLGGLYGPATENQHNKSVLAYVAAYSFFTFQTPFVSVGAGPEIGYGGPSVTMGLELGPFSCVNVGAYARWFWPFVPAENITDDHRTHEFGVRVRSDILYFQYGYYQQMNGLREFDIFGTTYSAHAYHMFTIGALFDASTVRFLRH